ncbi:MAG: acyl-CoA dehydratase activase [Treponema sp.]|jgi:predicted CoA-substrate-specific enzyme activase|nr:acyl-CoA dehydratase activase [Treponema sp.]
MLHIGIDVGSTTVKTVVIQPETKEILFSRYERHNACQSEKVYEFLQEIFKKYPQEQFSAAFCGSGGRIIADLVHAPYIQEVVANSIAVRAFYPQAKVAVELGGQDAKIVFFYKDSASGRLMAGDMRMNGSCAGGTGAFIDEVASLLRIPVEEFDALAAKGTQVYDISGRCGVFAKTDIQPLLNQGGLLEDIALSTFHAIAKQTIGGLAQGLEIKPPVVFEGGPLTFNPTLIKVFQERLALENSDIILPPKAELFIAYGAALSINEMFNKEIKDDKQPADKKQFTPDAVLTSLSMYREIVSGNTVNVNLNFFNNDAEREEFTNRHKMPVLKHDISSLGLNKGDTLKVYMGIDAGSTTTKFVLIDKNENVVDSFYSPNKGEPLKVIRQALLDMNEKYKEAGITLEVIAMGTTGYGELLFDKALGADFHTVETVAHVAAAQKYIPGVSFILDIGGQDMKAINISNGIVTNITVNEACSSGCGSFLETFAENLKIPVDKIAEAALSAKNPARLGSRCTVFMNSTIITEQKNGKQADDIMAGLCRSIIENVFTKVVRISNPAQLGDKIVVQGGTLKNDAVLRAFEQYLGKNIVRAPFPGEMGAIGIALLTKREIEENGYTSPHGPSDRTRFMGFDKLKEFSYTQHPNLICPFCANSCNRTLVKFSNGLTWVTGNRCERGELVGDAQDPGIKEQIKNITKQMNAVPDMIKIREELLFKDYDFKQLLPQKDITIGLPRVLDFWRNMPFWKVFWNALGFKIKISKKSSRYLYEKGLQYVASDTVCFPAKLVHGHIQDLIESKVDRIFFPQINRLPPENPEPTSTFTCPVLKGYPLSIKHSDNPEEKHNIPLDSPICHWFSERDIEYQLSKFIKDTFNIPVKTTLAAIKQGNKAMEKFKSELTEHGKKIISDTEKEGNFAVVIAGRHYQYDEHINHNLSRYFTSIGIPVLTVDSLPDLKKVKLDKSTIEITNNNHANLLSSAIIAAEHPALEYVEIFSFGCGHDALYTDEAQRILNEISGKSPLILKMDESEISGPLRIRVRSFIETVMIRRKKEKHNVKPLGDPYSVKFNKGKKDNQKVILIPNVSRAFCLILSSALANDGFRVEPLPMGGAEAIAVGKRFVHNDMCLPAQIVIGEAILALQSGKYDPQKTVVGTAKVLCDCRLANYLPLTRKALDEAGFSQVPVITTDQIDSKNAHPGLRFTLSTYAKTVWGLIETDTLEFLRRKIRPYELNKGETDKIVENAFIEIADGLASGGISGSIKPFKKAINDICKIKYDRSKLREQVLCQGEYLLTFHPGSNQYIEDYLEKNGMEVIFPRMSGIYRHLFLNHTVAEIKQFKVKHKLYDKLYAMAGNKFLDLAVNFADKVASRHPLYEIDLTLEEKAKYSDHIMHHSIMSGESFLIAADILHYAGQGVRSFVILQPFGCLPNHICGRGVIKKIKETHPDIQILPLDYDPDVSFANIENRIQMLIMNSRSLKKAG